jgi:hypothetical protein
MLRQSSITPTLLPLATYELTPSYMPARPITDIIPQSRVKQLDSSSGHIPGKPFQVCSFFDSLLWIHVIVASQPLNKELFAYIERMAALLLT